jgi:hypothetical protein
VSSCGGFSASRDSTGGLRLPQRRERRSLGRLFLLLSPLLLLLWCAVVRMGMRPRGS